MARDEKAVENFVEQTAAVLTAAGFPRMPARALLCLMATERGGLEAQQIAERLGVSAAAVCPVRSATR
ncbi:hypothetical protein [Luethyella okanaganae]|uniref:Uncharacterized protein n=1 Tax=Luethyella okanaganae TaxID=69372 RepID=A0ABW1VIP3_9MICO